MRNAKAWPPISSKMDPYGHNIVIHTYPEQKEKIHTPLSGNASKLTGLSLQGSDVAFCDTHADVVEWIRKLDAAGKRWVVADDEPGNATQGLTNDGEKHEESIGQRQLQRCHEKCSLGDDPGWRSWERMVFWIETTTLISRFRISAAAMTGGIAAVSPCGFFEETTYFVP